MRKVSVVIIVLLGIICLFSCERGGKDELSGRSYHGYYGGCECLSLDFKSNSEVQGHLCSAEFVGYFSDEIYGHYEYKRPFITIVWDKTSPKNSVYKSMNNPDSIMINESLDTLFYYEGDRCYTIPKYRLYKFGKNDSVIVKIYSFCYQSLLILICYFIKYFIYIVLFAVVLFFGIKWRKKRLQNK